MAVFAHPDDETIALGARLRRFREAHLVHITDGAPPDGQDALAAGFDSVAAYCDARARELEAVLDRAALGNVSRECVGVPDQEAATHLLPLTILIAERLRQFQPEVVFTHPYEGGHPDHDACAFAVARAVNRIRQEGVEPPLVIEASFYHAGALGIATGSFLPSGAPVLEVMYPLSVEEQTRKRELLEYFRTQQTVLCAFRLDWERFRTAPVYDFHRPAHPAPVFYDRLKWRLNSQRFCELARQADSALRKTGAAG